MGLPFPARPRQAAHYFPIFATLLMISSIISICVWIHYTQTMIFSIKAALTVAGNGTAADNYFVLGQSVIATSVLFIIYACVIFGLCLWRSILEAEIDFYGEVKDKVQLYQMANLGVRICWMAIMTWMVLLLAGCAIFGVYVSNMRYLVRETLNNQKIVGGPPLHVGPYPDCPATCVDLWVVDYIDVPMSQSCLCDPATLQSIVYHLNNAVNGAPGCITGVFLMYIVGGFFRSELSKHHAAAWKEQDVAARLAAGHAPGVRGALEAGAGPGAGARQGHSGATGYRQLANGNASGRGGAGRGRGR